MISEYHIGGVILYSVSGNIESPEQVAKLTSGIQKAAKETGGPGLIVAVDQEGGPVTRLKQGFTVFPPNMAAAAAGLKAVRTKARITASELMAVGVNMNFAPVADVNVNPDNPIIGVRSYGSDPAQVSRMVAAAVEEYRKANIASCAKHFPGHGDTGFDSHVQMPVVDHDRPRLEAVEFAPFRAAIAARAPAIMTAHVSVPALTGQPSLPATMSRSVLVGLLRQELGFHGLIVTDSLGMGALDKRFGIAESAELAFTAGADILLFGADKGHTPAEQKTVYAHLLQKFRSGKLSEKMLDAAVLRILEFKREYGLLEPVPASPKPVNRLTGTPEHHKAALNAAKKSITLLRDKEHTLPIRPWEKTLVITFGPQKELPPALSDALVVALPLDPGPAHVTMAAAAARVADKIIVLFHDAKRHSGQVDVIEGLEGPGVIAALTGAPYDAALIPDTPCVICSYSNVSTSMAALAGALFGDFRCIGELPVDLPAPETQSP